MTACCAAGANWENACRGSSAASKFFYDPLRDSGISVVGGICGVGNAGGTGESKKQPDCHSNES